MSEYVQKHSATWAERLKQLGHSEVAPLAAGVEGAIYSLGGGVVAKVWARRRRPELLRTQEFYADVASAGLPFATPVMLSVEEIDGVGVTFEKELHGRPLQKWMLLEDRALSSAATDCVVRVIGALAGVAGTSAMRRMSVLDEDRSFWSGVDDFVDALIALLDRRTARFGPLLDGHVDDFEDRYSRIVERLRRLDCTSSTVIHGDLFGENILVDDVLKPLSVLDFGFLSTAGDPRLEAGIAASIMNMYGPHGSAIATTLARRFAAEFGYPVDILVLYRAVYAVATSNIFSADGSDGAPPVVRHAAHQQRGQRCAWPLTQA
jgi:aminoglycoside phosphotransferase (APT) family kinase protein